ncbi:MAG: ribonuclease HI family protein [Chloroflexota bacterium]
MDLSSSLPLLLHKQIGGCITHRRFALYLDCNKNRRKQMLTLRFDGLFRNVPTDLLQRAQAGFMCYGWLVWRGSEIIARGHGGVARSKNANSNIAEYLALIEGMDALLDLVCENEKVRICGDAKSVIDQMRGMAEVNASSVKPLYRRAIRLAQHFHRIHWVWTPRKDNHEADVLTRRALRQIRSDKQTFQTTLHILSDGKTASTQGNKFLPLMDLRVYGA